MRDPRSKSEPSAAPRGAARREAESRRGPRPRLTLLRHGEPEWAPAGGPTVNDPGLTPFGAAQARAAADALAREPIDAIYVSPYRRAQETAEPLVRATGLEPVTLDALAEYGYDFEGMTQEQVDALFVEAARRPLRDHWDGLPGGESFHAFHDRVAKGVAELLARHAIRPERREDFTVWHVEAKPPSLVVVAHGGTNAVLCAHLLDVRPVPWEWIRFESALAAYSVVQARPLGEEGCVWSLQNFNELDHLRGAGLL
ncbi:MAG: histidine phosphatase family protein [Deltaproteobacteria bacterium]|nr:MAG: histidine phosphatase family protein [Deltaproteobacteria bacterium]